MPFPTVAGLGLPRHPGPARHHRHARRSRCCWSSSGRVFPQAVRAADRGTPEAGPRRPERVSIAVLVASAIFQLVTGLLNIGPVVPVELLVPRHPLRPRLGRDRLPSWCTSRSSCRSSGGALTSRRRVDASTTGPPRPSRERPVAARAAAHDLARHRASRCSRPPAAPSRGCARSRSSRSAAATGRRACRSTSRPPRPASPTSGRSDVPPRARATATGASQLSRDDLAGDAQRDAEPADRLRRGLERQRRRGPVSGCATCSTWSTRRRAATSTSTSLQQCGRVPAHGAPGELRRRRPHPLALALHGEPLDLDHGYPARLIAPNRPGVLQTKWVRGSRCSA